MMSDSMFRSFRMGKEEFTPVSYNLKEFVMDYKLEPGGGVPSHFHQYSDELFEVMQGEMSFKVNGEEFSKKSGESLMVPKGMVHSISNAGKETAGLRVTYSPCADVHRMFEILDVLDRDNPGSAMNMVKYFYLVPRLGLKPFSTVSPAGVNTFLNALATLMGAVLGWKKLLVQFRYVQSV